MRSTNSSRFCSSQESGLCCLLLNKSAILDKGTDVTHFLIQRSSKWIYSIFSYFILKIYDLRHFIEKQNCNLGKMICCQVTAKVNKNKKTHVFIYQ